MTQLSANTSIFDQMAKKIGNFFSDYLSGKFKTKDEMLEQYNEIVRFFNIDFQKPLIQVEQFIKGEPPVSAKINRFSKFLEEDINIVSKQIDNISAKTISTFNLFSQEIENEKRNEERIASKVKILEMYSRSNSSDIYYYGDSFENTDYVDFSKIKANLNPSIYNGKACLPLTESKRWQPSSVSMIELTGFTGNNHKVTRSFNSEGNDTYSFAFERSEISSRISTITDSNPATYFEIESVSISNNDLGNGIPLDYEFQYFVNRNTLDAKPINTYVNWNQEVDSLSAKMIMTRQSPEMLNCISITPFFGSSNTLKISEVIVYDSERNGINILSDPVYVGKSPISYDINTAKNYYHNKATIRFPEILSNRVEIKFEQEEYEDIITQHTYWATNYEGENTDSSPFFGQKRFNPESISLEQYNEVNYDKLSIIPKITEKNAFKQGEIYKNTVVFLKRKDSSDPDVRFVVPIKTQKEIRDGKRYSIGIRDIDLIHEKYRNSCEIVSFQFPLDYPLESLMLDMNYQLNGGSIRSYISVDDAKTWIELSPIQSGFAQVPEVLAFNKFVSSEYRLPGVEYFNSPNVPEEIRSIAIRINMFKNASVNVTPEIYSYQLIAKVKK
jgi:hypothetical protein